MAKKYADIDIKLTVSFEDDGHLELEAQAIEAAFDAIGIYGSEPEVMGVEVVGKVRDTEMPEQRKLNE